ncbi:MAG: RNA polymerase sigma factor [Bacteroidales bacterium]
METFEQFYKQHYLSLHRLAQKMLCHDTAHDIVQDVFVDYFEKSKKGIKVDFPKSYLYRSTLNKCIDQQRKNSKFAGDQIPEKVNNSLLEYENRETRQCISQCMATLGDKDRELTLLYSEGLSYKEISQITGIPFTSIGKTLSRALKKLEKELKVKGYELL